jgi:TatD DNase family protein
MLFDSHCHLDDPLLRPHLPQLLAQAEAEGVGGFLIPGVAPSGWADIVSLSATSPLILPAVGLHPMHAGLFSSELLKVLRGFSTEAVAIGEIGLDYVLPSPPRDLQQSAFRAQLKLARDSGLPVLIHCRKAFGDLLSILKEPGIRGIRGVMHAFSGSAEIAAECLRLGLYLSFGGTVTYANARRPLAALAVVPAERLLLETDAPDLAPEPHRGEVNLPAYLAPIARRVAELKGLGVVELGDITTANAGGLFGF